MKTRDRCNKILECKGFREIGIRTGVLARLFRFWAAFGRHDENRHVYVSFAKRPAEIKTIIRSEKDIDDEKVVDVFSDQIEGVRRP